MDKKSNIKFIQGAALGLALGIATNLFLKSKTGKKVKKEINHKLADFYNYISPKIKKMGDITEDQYKEFMDKAVDQYVKLKKVSVKTAKDLKDEVMDSFSYFTEQEESQ